MNTNQELKWKICIGACIGALAGDIYLFFEFYQMPSFNVIDSSTRAAIVLIIFLVFSSILVFALLKIRKKM
jgi:hypothetical protein